MYVVPEHIVKLEPLARELFVTRIVTITGSPEVVEGSPSEVSKKLRNGQ